MELLNEAEYRFKKVICRRGFYWERATSDEDKYGHFDCKIQKKVTRKIRVEVKGEKKINRYDNHFESKTIWLETMNVRGYTGWLNGKADLIAFEMYEKYHFEVYSRKDILRLLKDNIIDRNFVSSPKEAILRPYRRRGRLDIIYRMPVRLLHTIKYAFVK